VDPSGHTAKSSILQEYSRTKGVCGGVQGEVGIMGRANICVTGGHLQLQLQFGASSGVGGFVGATFVGSDAESASQLSGWGAGFGGSVSPGLSVGLDRSFSVSNGKVYNTISVSRGAAVEISPELSLPGEIHAYGSFTIDFNDLVHTLVTPLF
jgi:hypothetical protein